MGLLKSKTAAVMILSGESLTLVLGQESRIDDTNSAEIRWSDPQKAREDLQKLFPVSRRRQISELCLVLPRLMFFSKQIRLPSVDLVELRKMAALQISQHLPYPVEQSVWDVVIDNQVSSSASDVLLLAIQKEGVMKYLRVLAADGIVPTHVTVSSSAAAALLGSIDSTSRHVLFLTGENSCEFCFARDGAEFYSSRGIGYGRKDLQTDKLKDFYTQVRLTFEAQRKSFPQSAVAGGYFLRNIDQQYPKDFLDHLSQGSGLSWKELPAENVLRARFKGRASVTDEMLAGAALLQRGFAKICNFLPREYSERNTVKILRQKTVVTAVLVFAFIVAMTLAVGAPVLKKQAYLRQLDAELKRIADPASRSRQEAELLIALKQTLDERVSPLRFIEEIYRSIPQGVSLAQVRINSRNELELQGQALQSSMVNDLQENMITSGLFRDVQLERAARRTGPLGDVIYFTINAVLKTQQEKDSS